MQNSLKEYCSLYGFSAAYLLLIPFVNWMFSWAPVFPLPDGSTWTPFSVITGLVLVFRDFAQREIGNRVGILLLIGALFSYFLAAPEIAIVSGLAFMVSEGVDWAVYHFFRLPLHRRILLSSIISAPVDSFIFLYGANLVVPGVFSTWSVVASVSSKLVGAVIVAILVQRRYKKSAPSHPAHSIN